ncbi:hypothetical protein [Methyloceanibacter sp. wino2]|uniref:hypothetical protein n=1 Tax=Methyloceanibacter sp. wino2 TaxID=2170729 RepID=UPI001ABB00BD|nr:hypothetical protein [Methyloceanibacter sp. wino2]
MPRTTMIETEPSTNLDATLDLDAIEEATETETVRLAAVDESRSASGSTGF